MKILKQYQCGICKTIYDEQADAEKCEAQGLEKAEFELGDLVVTETSFGRFGWFDGDPAWVIKRGKDFRGRSGETYSLIYVITAITPSSDDWNLHRLCYHLVTKGMSGEQGYQQGYTLIEGHRGLCKVEANLDGSDLIGQEASYLI